MRHYWINEEKKYGFYIVGFFDKGKLAKFSIQREKPFEIDHVEGEVKPKCIRGFKENRWASNWFFMEGHKIGELNMDNSLRDFVNDIWEGWCKEHKRKYSPILCKLPINTPLRNQK